MATFLVMIEYDHMFPSTHTHTNTYSYIITNTQISPQTHTYIPKRHKDTPISNLVIFGECVYLCLCVCLYLLCLYG